MAKVVAWMAKAVACLRPNLSLFVAKVVACCGQSYRLRIYWPVFHGTWFDVVPRDKEDTTWRFIVMRHPPGFVNEYTPAR